MNHDRIAAEDTVQRYLRDELSADESTAFEQHYLDCQQCLDEIATVQGLREGLSAMVDGGELTLPSVAASKAALWHSPAWSMAATVLLAISLLSSGVLVKDKFQSGKSVATSAEVFSLVAVRSGPNSPPINQIRVASSTGSLVFQVDTGQFDEHGPYSVKITAEATAADANSKDGAEITLDSLHAGPDQQLAISIPADALPSGDYRVDVYDSRTSALTNQVRFSLVR